MIMQKRRHNHYGLVETFNVQGEGASRCHNKPLDRYHGHDWNINEFIIHERMILWILTSLMTSQ